MAMILEEGFRPCVHYSIFPPPREGVFVKAHATAPRREEDGNLLLGALARWREIWLEFATMARKEEIAWRR
jgi:hypothetical protein